MFSLKNFLMFAVLIFAVSISEIAEAGIVTDKVPLQCYVDHKVTSYDTGSGRAVGWIDADVDLVQITGIDRNGVATGTHPSGSKRVQRLFWARDVFADTNYANRNFHVNGSHQVYRTKNSGSTIGSISNEDVTVVADNGNRAQIIYRLDNGTGYKMGWVPSEVVRPSRPEPNKANFQMSGYNLTSPSDHQLRFTGRLWNANNSSEITGVHVYIGGGVGAGGEFMGEFRSDANHNFDATLNVPQHRNGNQLIVIYAVNGIDAKELDRRNINVSSMPSPSGDYDNKVSAFINDSRFKHGANWSASKTPTITGAGTGWGCNAYARDFVRYVFNTTLKGNGSVQFYDINEIKDGDAIYVSPSDHWIVILYRKGDYLTTAEGNWEGKVVVGDIYYKIQDGKIYHRNRVTQNYTYFRPFQYGYHHK